MCHCRHRREGPYFLHHRAIDRVIAVAAAEGVHPDHAINGIVAGDRIGIVRPDNIFDTGERIGAAVAIAGGAVVRFTVTAEEALA